jgi:dUTP pyrophosphatase
VSRFFEVAKEWMYHDINLPKRQTTHSAGYDFEAAEDVSIVPIWRSVINHMTIKPQKVHTGITVSMGDNESLLVFNRSSNPIKRLLMLANGTGVIDADYKGEITFDFWNFSLKPVHIEKGDRIGQGIFIKFLLSDNDIKPTKERTGGNGSTDTK